MEITIPRLLIYLLWGLLKQKTIILMWVWYDSFNLSYKTLKDQDWSDTIEGCQALSALLSPLSGAGINFSTLSVAKGLGHSETRWWRWSTECFAFLDLQEIFYMYNQGERAVRWSGTLVSGIWSLLFTSLMVEISYLWWHSIITFFYFTWDIDRQGSLIENLEMFPILL